VNFDASDPMDEYDPNGIEFPMDPVLQNITESFGNQLFTGAAGANSKAFVQLDIWTPIIDELNQYAGPRGRNFLSKLFFGGDDRFINPAIITADGFNGMSEKKYREYTGEIFQYIQDNQDSLPENLKGINAELIDSLVQQSFEQAQADEAELAKNNPGFVRGTARFVAGMGASFADPVTQATIPFGGWSKTLWKNVAQNMIINAGTGAVSELAVAEWYAEMGADYTYADFVRNVSLNAALGGAIPLGGRGISMTWQQAKKAVNAFRKSGRELTPESQVIVDALDDLEDADAANPFSETTAIEEFDAGETHAENLSLATGAAVTNTQPMIPYEPILPLKTESLSVPVEIAPFRADDGFDELRIEAEKDVGGSVVNNPVLAKEAAIRENIGDEAADAYMAAAEARSKINIDNRIKKPSPAVVEDGGGPDVRSFNPSEITVDAETFQFKSDGDEFGVSERLQGVTKWDKYKAGLVTVYEYADGRISIADGHQRLGLAKRIAAQDPSQEIEILGFTLREVDGITPEMARAIAAMKNIAEGTGTAIDAAKVLRTYPERLSELPPRSELVRQARDMMPLSDNAFGAIVNGVIPANYGAIVGRLIDDEKLQDAAIQVLAKADPSNAFQAEAIVRQVRSAGAEDVKQVSLFGDELVSESFYIERSKILDRAYKDLRQDKNAFETLVRNSERLEAEGNVLATEANQRKATTDAQTIAILQTLANRKGPLSDALTEAARVARETGNYGPATGGFLDAVRRSIESGDFDRLSTGDIGRTVDGPTPRPRSEIAEEPALEGFDEPSGIAAERQSDQLQRDMFGADEIADTPAAVAQADLEMQSALQEVQDKIQPDWQPYMAMEAGDTLVAMKDIVPVNVRAKGVVNSLGYMVQSANNEIPKRGSLLLRDNGDGTFSVRDGNSTYSIAKAAGWSEVPGKIIDDAQYASELSRKAADRILNQDALGKNKMRYVVAETLGQDEADIFAQKLLERQRFKTGLGLFRKAKKNNETLNKAAAQAAADLGIEFEPANVKKLKRIEEKVRDKYNGKYNRLTDAARTGVNAATMEEADAFVKALSKKFHLVDEGWKLTSAGYFDRKLMVIFDDKSLGEIQIWPPGMLKAKKDPTLFEKSGHDYYEISRSVDSTDVEIADANQKMIEIYGAVTSTLDQSFAQKLGTGAPRASSVDSTLSSEISSEPSSVTTARASSLEPPTGDQPSSVSQIMPSGPSMAAIEPKSNLNNFMDDTSDFNLDIASANVNLDLEVPVGTRVNIDTGEVTVRTLTLKELKSEMAKEQAVIDRLEFCTI
tara:strand:- start:2448 stop:6320 length:3873 start_codon:yes stop_codon:yes gene_type:complete